jgi:16S rRNA (guanine527-N7)-methyltransferase
MKAQELARNLKTTLKENGVTFPLTDEMYLKLAQFYIFLMDYQKKYNLTRLETYEEIAIKHFVDCIYVPQLTEIPDRLLDLGTGAGFPGVPLKIALPEKKIILAEGVQKKVDYLKELREHLDLKGLDIIGRKVESKMQYPVNGVITRAVEVVESTLKNVIHCLQTNGRVIFMKTPDIDVEMEIARKSMGEYFELIEDKKYQLGNTSHKRRLVVYKKIKSLEAGKSL